DMLSRPNELDVPDNGNYSDPCIPKFFKMPVRNSQGQNLGNTYVIKHRKAGLWMKGSAVYPKKENYTVMDAPWQVNSINCSDIFIKIVLEEQKKTFATTRQFNNSLYSQFKHSAYNEVKEKSKENLKRKNIWSEVTDDKAKCMKREVHNYEPPNLQAVTIDAITEEEKQNKRMRKLNRNLEIDMDDSGKIKAGRSRRKQSENENDNKINQHNDYSTQLETDKSNTINDSRAKGKPHITLSRGEDNELHDVTDIITDLKDTPENNKSLENDNEEKDQKQNMPNNTTDSENVETRKEDQYLELNKNPKQQAEDNTLLLKDLSPELVKNLQKECDFYKDIIEALQQGLSSRVYIMIGGLLHYIDEGTKRSEPLVRACIPRVLVGGLLDSYHKWYSHPSADKTYYSIRKKYYWPNMYSDCHHFTQKCRKCRAVNAKQTIAPLGRPEIPTEAGLDLSIDFVGPLIISLKGNKYIFTILDKFSNYLHAHPIPEKSSNMAISYILDQYIPTQGCPKTISSDNDQAFASDAMLAIYSSFGIRHVTTSSYNPKANKVERSHRFLSEYFKKTMEDDYQCWDEALPRIVMTYNCTPGKSGLSPMEVHMGRQPNIPFDFLFGTQPKYMGECDVKRKLQDTHVRFAKARKELLRTQEYNAQYQKRKVNRPDFQLFDKVMIKDYMQKPSGTKKLRPRYMADFKIVKQLAQDTFVVENVKNGRRYRRHVNDIIKDNNESAWHRKFDDFTPKPYKKCRPKYYDEDPIIPKIKTPIRDRLPRSAKNAFDTYMTSSEESELEENTGTHCEGVERRKILDAVRFRNGYTTRNVGNDDTQMDQQHTQPIGPLQQNDHENRYHRSQSYDMENNDITETMDYKQISPSHMRENSKNGKNESDYGEIMKGISRKRGIQAEINDAKFQKLDNDMIPMDNEEMDASDSELLWDDTSHNYVYNNYRIKRNSGKSQRTCI
ncbi:MAG: integrase, partial [Candidatus Nitrosopelagicus sp.]|nr:integrase [Candidatus Nitrosopelagicus sp.]